MSKSRIKDRSSKATACLEQVWVALQKLESSLPSVVVVILDAKARRQKGGHFARSTWKYRDKARTHEIAISPYLFQNPKVLLACMLHEAAHAILHKDRGGCGNDGYYHKKIFTKLAVNLDWTVSSAMADMAGRLHIGQMA